MGKEVFLEEKEEPPSGADSVANVLNFPVPEQLQQPDSIFSVASPENCESNSLGCGSTSNSNRIRIVSRQYQSGKRTNIFRQHFYPEITDTQWNSWQWQLQNRIKDLTGLSRLFNLSENEFTAIQNHSGSLPSSVTPYYASLIDRNDPSQAIRRTVIKVGEENTCTTGESDDPLHEDNDSPVQGIVHRYPDRVLFLVTGTCLVYCRYCTRSRMVGSKGGEYKFNVNQWERGIEYIRQHNEIRDVLLSGGDPLTIGDDKLDWLLSRLRAIPHVEIIRIGTKSPVVLPQRITSGLVRMLKKHHPVWMSIHFTHPDELTPEVADACVRLANAGIPLGSQTVLLKGINDDVAILKSLYHGLLKIRVKPYYLYQCDPVAGSSHFRTTVSKGLDVISGLRGFTSGYAVPHYVIDAPGGGGKIPLLPETVVGFENGNILLRNFEGNIYRYPDSQPNSGETREQ
ncbi:MAG: KamA family radical SAM protein [Deltaproteobacteria bacterium]|nr:KamA family radical SAM protein [Deltaproteobacteria bacterium]MBN2671377.1 KamA family radical SAM protein [Deltaproteobacteria bacterium]